MFGRTAEQAIRPEPFWRWLPCRACSNMEMIWILDSLFCSIRHAQRILKRLVNIESSLTIRSEPNQPDDHRKTDHINQIALRGIWMETRKPIVQHTISTILVCLVLIGQWFIYSLSHLHQHHQWWFFSHLHSSNGSLSNINGQQMVYIVVVHANSSAARHPFEWLNSINLALIARPNKTLVTGWLSTIWLTLSTIHSRCQSGQHETN